MSKVSVLIPYYNHEKFIERTLNSILDDNYVDKEIIIINDGSPCNGDKVIKEWIKKNEGKIPITYKYRENKGLTYTLNEMIGMSSGEYITLVGSDDALLQNGIKQRVDFLKKHSGLKAVFADSIVVDYNDNLLYESALFGFRKYPKDAFIDTQSIKNSLIKRFTLAGPVLMVKKDIYDIIGLYDTNLLAEDLDFYLHALSKNLVGFLNEKVCVYRIHGKNQSLGAITPRLLRDARKAFMKNIKLYPPKYKIIMGWIIVKFFIREQMLKLKLSK